MKIYWPRFQLLQVLKSESKHLNIARLPYLCTTMEERVNHPHWKIEIPFSPHLKVIIYMYLRKHLTKKITIFNLISKDKL